LPPPATPSILAVRPERPPSPAPAVQPVKYQAEKLHAPAAPAEVPPHPVHQTPPPAVADKPLVVDVLAVLRLTEEQNPHIAIEREKVHQAEVEAAALNGPCVSKAIDCLSPTARPQAEAGVWRAKAELSRVTYETLQEAGNTYVDLLSARAGQAIVLETEGLLLRLLERAENLKARDVTAAVLVEMVQTDVAGHRQNLVRLRDQENAALAKLANLLGLPCDAHIVPADLTAVPFNLVDASQPLKALIERALAEGPGAREARGLVAVAEWALAQLQTSCCPLAWLGLEHKLCLARSRLRQAELGLEETYGKLTLGVRASHGTICAGPAMLARGEEMIKHARETYRLSDLRLRENVPGATIPDVSQAIRALDQSRSDQVNAISDYNKAQVRLLLVLGPGAGKCAAPERVVPGGKEPTAVPPGKLILPTGAEATLATPPSVTDASLSLPGARLIPMTEAPALLQAGKTP
jgi:hypothetical protein